MKSAALAFVAARLESPDLAAAVATVPRAVSLYPPPMPAVHSALSEAWCARGPIAHERAALGPVLVVSDGGDVTAEGAIDLARVRPSTVPVSLRCAMLGDDAAATVEDVFDLLRAACRAVVQTLDVSTRAALVAGVELSKPTYTVPQLRDDAADGMIVGECLFSFTATDRFVGGGSLS